jgi:hypothetical protein
VDAALREVLDDARRVADLILRTSRSVTVIVVDISDVCVLRPMCARRCGIQQGQAKRMLKMVCVGEYRSFLARVW